MRFLYPPLHTLLLHEHSFSGESCLNQELPARRLPCNSKHHQATGLMLLLLHRRGDTFQGLCVCMCVCEEQQVLWGYFG